MGPSPSRRALLAGTAVLLVAGCTPDRSRAVVGSTVTIGYLAPLTGPDSAAGASSRNGAELAAMIVNHPMPLIDLPLAPSQGLPNFDGTRIAIEVADTASDPLRTYGAVNHLVRDKQAVALSGAYESGVTAMASARAEQLAIPFVNGDSSATSLTERGLKWFFRTGPTDLTFGQLFFSLLKERQLAGSPVQRLAVIHTQDQYGTDGRILITQLAAQSNRDIVCDLTLPTRGTDLTSRIKQLAESQPDAVFALAYADMARRLVDTLQQTGYFPPALLTFGAGFADPTFVRSAGQAAEATVTRAAWSPDLAQRNPTAKAVADLYRTRFKAPMDDVAARAFTAVMTIAQAMDAAGSSAPDSIRTALIALQVPGVDTIMPWDGIAFDENQQNTGARGTLEQFTNGSYRVVYPDDVADEHVIWPMRESHP